MGDPKSGLSGYPPCADSGVSLCCTHLQGIIAPGIHSKDSPGQTVLGLESKKYLEAVTGFNFRLGRFAFLLK